jgi:60 kDa SS-A/Ro ribonucleoprotein
MRLRGSSAHRHQRNPARHRLCFQIARRSLDEAFYATFQNVEPCGKPVLLVLDVSGSMAGSMIAGSCISAREASAAMALITAATEPDCEIIAFSAGARGYPNDF